LLTPDKYKNIIVNSLCFLVQDNRIMLNAFVIMPNHIHLIWQMKAGKKVNEVQRDFLKFTAQRIKADLSKNHPQVLAGFKVDATDREYQFWGRNPLSIEPGFCSSSSSYCKVCCFCGRHPGNPDIERLSGNISFKP